MGVLVEEFRLGKELDVRTVLAMVFSPRLNLLDLPCEPLVIHFHEGLDLSTSLRLIPFVVAFQPAVLLLVASEHLGRDVTRLPYSYFCSDWRCFELSFAVSIKGLIEWAELLEFDFTLAITTLDDGCPDVHQLVTRGAVLKVGYWLYRRPLSPMGLCHVAR